MKFLFKWILNVISLFILDLLFTGISFTENKSLLLTGLILVFVNSFIKPILKFISFPITFLTLGLFSFVLNAIILQITFNLSNGANIDSFKTAIFAAFILAIINPALKNIKKR